MSIASRLTDLTDTLISVINARAGKVGASAYDLYVLGGGTLTQAQWLAYNGPRAMTTAQRQALAGSDLWVGRLVTDTNTGHTWKWTGATLGWGIWDTNGDVRGAAISLPSGVTESSQANDFSVRSGVMHWAFSLQSTTGRNNNDQWATINDPYRSFRVGLQPHGVADYYNGNYGLCVIFLYGGFSLTQGINQSNSAQGNTIVNGMLIVRVTD